MNKKIKNILMTLSFLGFLDSLYLSMPYIFNTTTYCVLSDANSCNLVLNSKYATMFFGIPNAILGIIFYLSLFLIFIFWDKIILKVKNILKLSILLSGIGSIFYIYFIYLQKYIIESYCPYCLFSSILTFSIFIILILIYRRK